MILVFLNKCFWMFLMVLLKGSSALMGKRAGNNVLVFFSFFKESVDQQPAQRRI